MYDRIFFRLAQNVTDVSFFCSALYQLMKKTSPFEWNGKADEAFQDLKRMLSTAPVLAALAEKEPLLLYIAATSRSVSTVMVVE